MTSLKVHLVLSTALALLPFILPLPSTTVAVKFFLSVFTAVLTCSVLSNLPRGRLPIANKAVLVTGCDSGFGLAAAQYLHSLGYLVFAGCLFKDKGGEGASKLMRIDPTRLKVLQLDVASEVQVREAVHFVKQHLIDKNKGLWGLVNNAGVSFVGEIEWCTVEKYKWVCEVNLFGMIRVTKAFLPLIRKARGRIVNMSSGISRQAIPTRSVYCVSKFAVQGFSDCLRYEMVHWGVKVSIVEPGNFIAATGIFNDDIIDGYAKELWEGMSEEVRKDYGKRYFDDSIATMRTYSSSGVPTMKPVIDAYVDALVSKRPKIRYYAMPLYWQVRRLVFTHLPECIADAIYHGIYYS
ncbi:D-beta-hydroxybutyrate dehydrogenase, mitochondrial-like [Saccoglossus kowalevskii]|uniref:D-beta-hydroxybutyrate dehydrogenase, mitochondrial-like n=1 Tax=Saccoglossus kowalevskii TaxID=10224 RepID=A0ABM0GS25_SACKO|nr:PREDICTED: D-beta-hydroxybutyrate dehydrogenase, mitochondrial-like [Saccoglossus kowalevskii]